jgi:hypothetical protein
VFDSVNDTVTHRTRAINLRSVVKELEANSSFKIKPVYPDHPIELNKSPSYTGFIRSDLNGNNTSYTYDDLTENQRKILSYIMVADELLYSI